MGTAPIIGALASSLPDPGDPSLLALGATLGGFLGFVYGLIMGVEHESEFYWYAFRGGMYGTGLALFFYLFGLVTGLY